MEKFLTLKDVYTLYCISGGYDSDGFNPDHGYSFYKKILKSSLETLEEDIIKYHWNWCIYPPQTKNHPKLFYEALKDAYMKKQYAQDFCEYLK